MTSLPWILAVAGWLLAAAAWVVARSASRRARQLHDMYWQLRYDHGELKATVSPPPPEPPVPSSAFVPLETIKRAHPRA